MKPSEEPRHFFDDPVRTRWFFRAFFLACGVTVAADLFHRRHGEASPLESLFGFYGVFGFVAIVVLILAAKQLRRLVMREEDYYDR